MGDVSNASTFKAAFYLRRAVLSGAIKNPLEGAKFLAALGIGASVNTEMEYGNDVGIERSRWVMQCDDIRFEWSARKSDGEPGS